MKHLFLVAGLLCAVCCAAQQSKIDSLLLLIKTESEDTLRIKHLNGLCWEYKSIGQYDNGLKYGNVAVQSAKDIIDKSNNPIVIEAAEKAISNAYNNIGTIYAHQGNLDNALENFYSALRSREKIYARTKATEDNNGIAAAYNNIGLVCAYLGNYNKAIENYIASLKIYEKTGKKEGIAAAYGNMGGIYLNQENFQTALKIDTELGDKQGIAFDYNNIGLIYSDQGENEKGLENHTASLKIKLEIGDKQGAASSYGNIGIIYDDWGKPDKALENYFAALKIYEDIGDQQGASASYSNIGKLYLAQGKTAEAEKQQLRSLGIAKEIGAKEIIKENYRLLALCDSAYGNWKGAYEYHKMFSETKDSILNEESSKQIAEMQTKYETEKKEQQITLLNKDKELQDAQLNRQKIIIWSVAGGLFIVLILSIFIFRERRKSERLLLNILPAETARELKAKGKASPRHYESVTVMFTDFKGFTTIAEKLSAEELVSELDFLFKKFDEIISKYSIEKIKTIGDSYMCASGLPTPNSNHAEEIVKAGIEIQSWMKEQNGKWSLRMGIHSGPVTAGVVGDKKFAYDIWGDTVNIASRMESSGEAGKINISGTTHELLCHSERREESVLKFTHRGKIPAKNKGEIEMYFVERVGEKEFIGG